MILTLRTDKPEAEIGLYDESGKQVAYDIWYAHRELADTLLGRIEKMLQAHHRTFKEVSGLVVFKGPGSFTGLRIGISVANALAYAQEIPIIGAKGEEWQTEGIAKLAQGKDDRLVLPEYGAEANITKPRK